MRLSQERNEDARAIIMEGLSLFEELEAGSSSPLPSPPSLSNALLRFTGLPTLHNPTRLRSTSIRSKRVRLGTTSFTEVGE